MLNPEQRPKVYGLIDNIIEEFLNEKMDEAFDKENIVTLEGQGIIITIDVSKFKN